MNRRDVLGAAIGGASLVIAMDNAFADEEHHHEHAASGPSTALSEAARHCVSSGDACVSHCLQLFTQGDTTTAAQKRVPNDGSLRSARAARLGQFRACGRVREDRSHHLPRL